MDRERPKSGHPTERGPSLRSGPDILSQPLLPSRQRAYAVLREAVDASRGPVVIGGAPGVGKTWLWRRLEAESPVGREWISVTASPEMTAIDLLILTAFNIGASAPDPSRSGIGLLRASILDRLSELEGQGIEVVLTVEESHHLDPGAREELNAIASDAGLGAGLKALVLAGRSHPRPRRTMSDESGWEARLSARIHLGPIDADEASAWLRSLHPGRSWTDRDVEALHRDARGNPKLLDRLALSMPMSRARDEIGAIASAPPMVTAAAAPPPANEVPASLVGPSRPPIQIEENAVEVGWVPDDASQEDVFSERPSGGAVAEIVKPVAPNVPPLVIKPSSPLHTWPADGLDESDPRDAVDVRDSGAAIRAWDEWSRAHAANAPPSPGTPGPTAPLDPTPNFSRREGSQEVWAETEQEFAPYGPMFQRIRPARES